MKKLSTAVLLLGVILVAAQESEEKGKQIEDIVIVGNRNVKRTKLETPVPVDVINIDKIQRSAPQMTAQDLLNYVIPSFNAVRQSASDGTEHIDPVTLRGMGPDQVLVLLKRKKKTFYFFGKLPEYSREWICRNRPKYYSRDCH